MYKVFFNDKEVILTDAIAELPEGGKNPQLFYIYTTRNKLKEIINSIENHSEQKLFIYYENLSELKIAFKSCFKIIEAAGGVVWNKNGDILFIRRMDKWDLPKGKLKIGETKKQSAIREVNEECGLSSLEIRRKIMKTRHTYKQKEKKWVLKVTTWYEMIYEGDETPTPQIEEDITQVSWFAANDLEIVYNDTFASLIPVIKKTVEKHT